MRLSITDALASMGITETEGHLCTPEDLPTLWEAEQVYERGESVDDFLAGKGLRPIDGHWNYASLYSHSRDSESQKWREEIRREWAEIRDASNARGQGY